MKCIVILSCKSAGSSACQSLLSLFADVRCVTRTRHFENETLYWTKAASVLGLPQTSMLDSEVPIPKDEARQDLIRLLSENLDGYRPPFDDREMIFEGWRALCKNYSPIFLEKSPHHLFQWSALELIGECVTRLKDIEFFFVGLVRNPMDVLYSAYKRWRIAPEKFQFEWATSYRNLLRFADTLGDRITIIRYEDMVRDPECLHPVFQFMHGDVSHQYPRDYFHVRSIQKWKRDRFFGFSLSPEVHDFALRFGYQANDLDNRSYALWPIQSRIARSVFRLIAPAETFIANRLRNDARS